MVNGFDLFCQGRPLRGNSLLEIANLLCQLLILPFELAQFVVLLVNLRLGLFYGIFSIRLLLIQLLFVCRRVLVLHEVTESVFLGLQVSSGLVIVSLCGLVVFLRFLLLREESFRLGLKPVENVLGFLKARLLLFQFLGCFILELVSPLLRSLLTATQLVNVLD